MPRAMHVQKRVVAAATAILLLCVGLLVRQHEADTAHAREQSGRIIHAQRLAEHHDISTNAHLHGREAHTPHAGECALIAIAHDRAVDQAPVLVAAPLEILTVATSATPSSQRAVAPYRYAPKTSPPSA